MRHETWVGTQSSTAAVLTPETPEDQAEIDRLTRAGGIDGTPVRGRGTVDLREFVNEALVQIVEGVRGAQERVKPIADVSPRLIADMAAKQGFLETRNGEAATLVNFDVALTVSEGTGTRGGIGVFVGAVTLGSSGQSSSESSSVSRVKFAVPLRLPTT